MECRRHHSKQSAAHLCGCRIVGIPGRYLHLLRGSATKLKHNSVSRFIRKTSDFMRSIISSDWHGQSYSSQCYIPCAACPSIASPSPSRAIRFIAEGTFPLYLLHFPLYVLAAAIVPYNHASTSAKLLLFITVFALSVLAGSSLQSLEERTSQDTQPEASTHLCSSLISYPQRNAHVRSELQSVPATHRSRNPLGHPRRRGSHDRLRLSRRRDPPYLRRASQVPHGAPHPHPA